MVYMEKLHIQFNTDALSATFWRSLQHQLDVMKLLKLGCGLVTPEQYLNEHGFMDFSPAANLRLDHAAAHEGAADWLLSGLLRDSIEATGLFLDECLNLCGLISLGSGPVASLTLHDVLERQPMRNHKAYIPDKLRRLRSEFDVSSDLEDHLLSLNKTRSCIVHRLGFVMAGKDDIDDGALVVRLIGFEMTIRDTLTGETVPLAPNHFARNASELLGRISERRFSFVAGQQVKIPAEDLPSIIVTLWKFSCDIVESIKRFGRSKGIPVTTVLGETAPDELTPAIVSNSE